MIDLVSRISNQDFSALAKAITIVENQSPGFEELLSNLYSHRKKTHKIGVTGPPGSGKSTLTSKIAKEYINQNKTIGIICVDPSSPFNGGAILGDRIRMQEIYNHENIFIRSLATRGSLGGLSKAVSDIEILFEAFGFDVIIYETVGVGQVELDVASCADSVILVLTPESGDDIQMMKAGLIECANIIVINKSDRSGADKMKLILEQIIELGVKPWKIPVIKAIAIKNNNIEKILESITEHYLFLKSNQLIAKKNNQKYIDSIKEIVKDYSIKNFFNSSVMNVVNEELEKSIKERLSPYKVFEKIQK